MPRTAPLDIDTLAALGADKLARLIADEAEGNPGFRKRVKAALAGANGPDAVAKLIDRRLAALEKARAMVAWEKERSFAADLDATVASILKELAPLSAGHALDRLLRFIDTHANVFERIDDSSGRIQDVYWRACEAVPDLVSKVTVSERHRLPARLTKSLAADTHGLAPRIAKEVVPHLPVECLKGWDDALAADDEHIEIRQAIADAMGDLDRYLDLEERRPEWRRNPLAAAERLLAGGRLEDALTWVRKERKGGLAYASWEDMAEGRINRLHDLDKVRLEARILEAMKDRPAAQNVRWAAFEQTLSAEILRDYVAKLGDFEEFDELDRAFALAAASPRPYSTLALLLQWPRLDLAAKLVIDRRGEWEGRNYEILSEAAEMLEDESPLAATILYRALLDDILDRKRSPAYGHGARHLARLGHLANHLPAKLPIDDHVAYVSSLKAAHGRKHGFWSLVKG